MDSDQQISSYFRGTRLGAYGYYPKPTTVVQQIVCPPEIKIIDELYWLWEGCSQFSDNLQPQWSSCVDQSIFHELCQEALFSFIYLWHNLTPAWIKFPINTTELLSAISVEYVKKRITRMLWLDRWSPDPLGRMSLRLPNLLHREGGVTNPWLQRDINHIAWWHTHL